MKSKLQLFLGTNRRKRLSLVLLVIVLGVAAYFISRNIFQASTAPSSVDISALSEVNGMYALKGNQFAVIKKETSKANGEEKTSVFTLSNGSNYEVKSSKTTNVSIIEGSDDQSVLIKPDDSVSIHSLGELKAPQEKIESTIYKKLKKEKSIPVIIQFSNLEKFYSADQTTETISSKKSKFEEKKSKVASLLRWHGKIKKDLQIVNGVSADIDETSLDKLKKSPEVAKVELDREVKALLDTSVDQIQAKEVWTLLDSQNQPITGTGTKIAIIDTGVDYTNPDLGGCLGANCKVIGGYDFYNSDSNPMDDNGHGTHVAATAAGKGALYGVAPDAKIFAYKVLNSSGAGSWTTVLQAVQAAADPNGDGNPSDHVDVASMSLGGPGNPDDMVSQGVDNASAVGVVSTIAAGNSGPAVSTIGSPGTARSAITVAAACKTSQVGTVSYCNTPIASFSSRGPLIWNGVDIKKPDVSAPGVLICAARWDSAFGTAPTCADDSNHVRISGTSMATPHVAGLAALVHQAYPDFTPAQVKDRLKASADDLGQSYDIQGSGLINAKKAIPFPSFMTATPNSWSIKTNPAIKNSTHSQQFSITPQIDTISTLTPSSNPPNGITITFDKTTLNVANKSTDSFTATMTIDNDIAKPGSQYTDITLTENGVVKGIIPVYLTVLPTMKLSLSDIDFGVDNPDLSSWTSDTKIINITNLRTDISQNVSSNLIGLPAQATLESSPSPFSLAPGASADLSVKIAVSNSSLSNGLYKGNLNLKANNIDIALPVKFAKYYAIIIQNQSEPVYSINYTVVGATDKSIYRGYIGDQKQATVYLPDKQNYDVLSEYLKLTDGGSPSFTHYFVLKEGINLSSGVATVPIKLADANHKMTLEPYDENNTRLVVPNSNFSLYRSGQLVAGNGFNGANDATKNEEYHFSDMSTIWEATYTVHNDQNVGLGNKVYNIGGKFVGITADQNITNTSADVKKMKFMLNINKTSSESFVPLIRTINAWTTYNATPKTFYQFQNYYTNFSDYWVSQISDIAMVGCSGPCDSIFETLPINPVTGARKVFEGEDPDAQPGDFPTVTNSVVFNGLGPAVWAGKFENTSSNIYISNYFGVRSAPAFLRQDFVKQDYGPIGYVLSKNGSQVSSGNFTQRVFDPNLTPDYGGTIASIPVSSTGNYELRVDSFPFTIGKTTMNAKMVANFNNSLADPSPPSIKRLYYFTNDVRSEDYNETVANRLEFELDPVGGSISSAKASYSTDGTNFTPMNLKNQAGNYSANLPSIPGLSKITLMLEATDKAGNSLSYSFELPRGDVPQLSVDPVPDSISPAVSITSPLDGATVSGFVNIDVDATDNVGVTKVTLNIDGTTSAGEDTTAPYSFLWGTSGWTGTHKLIVTAYDAAGHTSTDTHTVTIGTGGGGTGDKTPPTVSITSPKNGATLSRRTSTLISVNATDDVGVKYVSFYINGLFLFSDTSAPYSYSWKPSSRGSIQIKAEAVDTNGNTATSTITVNVK